MPPSSGRLMWLRSLQRRIVDPMDVLKTKHCVITHRDAQLSVKLYNFLMEMFLHHEMQLHKGWYDFAEEIRRNLSVRVLRKNVHTNWLEINFHPSIYQLIREGECILKLGLGKKRRFIEDDVRLLTFFYAYRRSRSSPNHCSLQGKDTQC